MVTIIQERNRNHKHFIRIFNIQNLLMDSKYIYTRKRIKAYIKHYI